MSTGPSGKKARKEYNSNYEDDGDEELLDSPVARTSAIAKSVKMRSRAPPFEYGNFGRGKIYTLEGDAGIVRRARAAIYNLFSRLITPITMARLLIFAGIAVPGPGGARRSRQRRQRQRGGGGEGGPNAGAVASAAAAAPEPPVNPVVELRAGIEAVTQNARGGVASIFDRIGRGVRAVGTYFTVMTSSFHQMSKALLYLVGLNTVIFGSSIYSLVLPVFQTIFTTPVFLDIILKLFANTAGGVAAVGMVGAVGAGAIGIGTLVLFLGWLLRRCSGIVYSRVIQNPINLISAIAAQDDIPPAARAAAMEALDAARRVVIDAAAARAAAAAADAAAAEADAAAAAALLAANEEITIITIVIERGQDLSVPPDMTYNMNDTIANIRALVATKAARGDFTPATERAINAKIPAAVVAAQGQAAAEVAAMEADLHAPANLAIEDAPAGDAAAAQGGAGGGGGGAIAAPSSSSAPAAAAASSPFGAVASPRAAAPGDSTGGSGFGGGYRRLRLHNKQNKKSKKRQNRKQNSKKSRRLRFRF